MGSVKFSGFSFRHGRRRISFPCLWRAVIGMATSAAMGMKTVRAEVPQKKNGPPWWFSPICVEGVYKLPCFFQILSVVSSKCRVLEF